MGAAALELFRELYRKTLQLPRYGHIPVVCPAGLARLVLAPGALTGSESYRSSRSYYRKHLKENFVSHKDETEPARIEAIMAKAKQDADWVVAKAPRWRAAVASCFALALYLLSSSAIVVMNKRLLVDAGFRFPLALTGAGQLTSAAAGLVLGKAGWAALGPAPSWGFFWRRLAPIAACAAGALYFGNLAYLSLSVAFIQILKVMTPAMTLGVCAAAGLERLNARILLAVGLITAGTAAATAAEMRSVAGGFAWSGFAAFSLSALLEAVRVVLMQVLLSGRARYNEVEVLVYLGPATGTLLLAGAAAWEWDGLAAPGGGLAVLAARPGAFAAALAMGFAVNLTTAFAIRATSGLTFKVAGCVKNTLVVWLGVLMGDAVSGPQLAGYAASMAGFSLYIASKWGAGVCQPHGRPSAGKKAL